MQTCPASMAYDNQRIRDVVDDAVELDVATKMVLGGLGGFGREASTPDCQTLGIPDLNLGSRLSLLEYAPDTIAGAVLSFVTVSLTCEAAGGGESWSGEGASAVDGGGATHTAG